ncbi:MAG: hypothetical protein KDB26_02260 [Microthrixaceae bacterium]|nr:hypothetical protein [Microthrixaceae bacterium]
MPEGHIIHRLAKELNETLGKHPVQASSPQGRFSAGAAAINGRPLVGADAYGKYLFCDFGIDEILHIHLGLIGKLNRKREPIPDPVGEIRLRLQGQSDAWDLSGPTRCDLITPEEMDSIIARLGADPLRRNPRVDLAREGFRNSKKPVGARILDQNVIAGIGNVYRAELLFLCGINPLRPSNSLSDEEFDCLWSHTVELMRIGKRLGRIVTTDPDEIGKPRGRMGDDERLYVYKQDRCRHCGTELVTAKVGGRAITYCPVHQPL